MDARAAALAVTLSLTAAGGALAQTAPRLVSPARADQNPPRRAPSAVRRPPEHGPAPPLRERNANAPIRSFTLQRVEIAGSSLSPGELYAGYRPFVGQVMDNPALSRLTQAVAAAYGRSDTALYTVLVPEQSFARGVLRVVVIEGFIQSVRIDGKLKAAQRRLIARYLEPVTRDRPLKSSTCNAVCRWSATCRA